MSIINRNDYIARIEKALCKDQIIVLTGQRRVGKSQLLKLMQGKLVADPVNNVIYINKEKREFDHIRTYVELNDYIASHVEEGRHTCIFIDEVQDINEFERSLRSWNTEADTGIIVTGSNAYMLSGELSTIIGGRSKEIYIQSLSYSDFLLFHDLADSDDNLMKYINYGGMPGLRKISLTDEEDVYDFLSDIYNTVLLKDVIMRNKIRNVSFIEDLVRFLGDSSGKLISASSVSKYMKGQGVNVSPTSLIEYIRFLSEAFIIQKVNRFDIHGKRIFENNGKFYFADHGIRNAIIGGSREGDMEKVLETIVYNQLIRMGYRVYVGQLQAGEVDFVCESKAGSRVYVQVSYIVADEATRKREFGNLLAIQDNYPKYVLSLTPMVTRCDYEGITHLHLRKFLIEGFTER